MTTGEVSQLDFASVCATLRSDCPSDDWMYGWLKPSWDDRGGFSAALHAEGSRRKGAASRLRPGLSADLFYDCAQVHSKRGRTALVVSSEDSLVTATFDSLCDQAMSLARVWREHGIKAGDCLAIALPVGPEYVAAILAAFYMGLVAAPIPPYGPTYVGIRVAQLKATYVVTQSTFMLRDCKVEVLPLSVPLRPDDQASFTYPPDAPALRLFSAFRRFDASPVDISAAELLHALLRDAVLIWALNEQDRVAMPGFDPVQLQPLSILTALRVGAAWVELAPDVLEREPDLLRKAAVTVLGVTPTLRTMVMAASTKLPPLRAWFRLLNEAYDYARWDALRAKLAEQKIPGFAVLSSAAAGGVHLSTQPSLSPTPTSVWPAPGRYWQLSKVGTEGFLAKHSGVYTSLRFDAKKKKYEPDSLLIRVVMSKSGTGWSFGGSIDPWPDARALPLAEIGKVAGTHPRVGAGAAVIAPGQWTNQAALIVGLFVPTDDLTGEVEASDLLIDEVRELLRYELGPTCVPGQGAVIVLPIYPEWKKDQVDLDWFRTQYLRGSLHRRSNEPLFVAFAQLSWMLGERLAK